MKKAFTMLELVFIIIIIGIMSAVLAPRADDSSLQQATNQVVSHIRFTQHLALTDNKFSNSDANWFRERWQIRFSNAAGGTNNGHWIYSIYSDKNKDGNSDKNETAKNPENVNQYLTGFYSNVNGEVQESEYTKNLDIESKFGMTAVTFTGGCAKSSQISFDRVGRPFYGEPANQTSPYQYIAPAAPPVNAARLLTSQCIITLTKGAVIKKIAIEPETGYVHTLQQ